MKKVYECVVEIKAKSGLTWDDELGVNVTHDTKDQWDELVKVRGLLLIYHQH